MERRKNLNLWAGLGWLYREGKYMGHFYKQKLSISTPTLPSPLPPHLGQLGRSNNQFAGKAGDAALHSILMGFTQLEASSRPSSRN